MNQTLVEVTDRRLFNLENERAIQENGPLDARMGISNKTSRCATCSLPLSDCNGHFGHVKLVLPVFHIGYFKRIIAMLQCICKVDET